MKNKIPKDTRYVPFTQQRACCVPTSITMVMCRHGIPLLPQELLGYHLGLIVDKKHKNLFSMARTGKRPQNGYGTQMTKEEYRPNSVFKKLKIPLKATWHRISKFENKKDLVDFIARGIKNNKDFIAIIGSDVLNGTSKNNGHAIVIDRIYPKKDTLRFVDPSASQPKWREIKINKFIKAARQHPGGKGGSLLELEKAR